MHIFFTEQHLNMSTLELGQNLLLWYAIMVKITNLIWMCDAILSFFAILYTLSNSANMIQYTGNIYHTCDMVIGLLGTSLCIFMALPALFPAESNVLAYRTLVQGSRPENTAFSNGSVPWRSPCLIGKSCSGPIKTYIQTSNTPGHMKNCFSEYRKTMLVHAGIR